MTDANPMAGNEKALDPPLDVVVIGGGQAGLAVAWHLARRGLPFVVLEAGDQLGHSWRTRWDSLRLFSDDAAYLAKRMATRALNDRSTRVDRAAPLTPLVMNAQGRERHG